jgi:hypothetical protein
LSPLRLRFSLALFLVAIVNERVALALIYVGWAGAIEGVWRRSRAFEPK